jgi:lipopolysaccharide transport system permease protein
MPDTPIQPVAGRSGSASSVSTPVAVEATHGRRVPRRRLAYHVDVVLHLVRVDLALRHRGSLLGWVWSLGPALFQLGATYFLFTRVIPLQIDNYPVFLLVGILAWGCFARAITDGTSALEAHRELVLRPGFAIELLPVSAAAIALVDYLLALPVVLVAVGLTTGLHPAALLLPVLLLIQSLLALGFAFVCAPLQVFMRDTRQFVGVAVMLGFWLTPVFYRRAQLPASLDWIYQANPMAHLVEAHRTILIEGRFPDGWVLGALILGTLVVLAGGFYVFERLKYSVPEQL